jgi:predicted cobalt transporter CbtA
MPGFAAVLGQAPQALGKVDQLAQGIQQGLIGFAVVALGGQVILLALGDVPELDELPQEEGTQSLLRA